MELRDEDGIRTGARRFYVRLRREGANGGLHHLPSTIQLGSARGHVFYAGQPKTCRKCGSLGHLAASCTTMSCRNCRSTDHDTRDCREPRRCNLCGSDAHFFGACPQSYANRARQPASGVNHIGPPPGELLAREIPPAEEGRLQDGPEISSQLDQQQPGTEAQAPPGPTTTQKPPEPPANQVPQESPPDEIREGETSGRSDEAAEIPLPASPADPQGTQDPPETQDDLPAAQHPGLATTAVISAEDCRNLLDQLMDDLPSTSEQGSNPPFSSERGEEPPLSLSLFSEDHAAGKRQRQTSSQKRPQQDSSEESIIMDSQVWPSPSSASASFLDDQSLIAFSTATQMKVEEGEGNKQKKPKKKRKNKNGKQSPDLPGV